ncbi:MAG TPA: hypothetical protein PK069_04015 [Methanolinea sp.]|nr:hypothetical protein [Methanolinea sp.]
MQLPRGTFHSMKKGVELGSILEDLKKEHFSGTCSLVCGNQSFDLVYQEGLIMLASGEATCGDAAMGVIEKQRNVIADALLSALTPAQMKLTLEFNAGCRVQRRSQAAQITPPAPSPGGQMSPGAGETPHTIIKPEIIQENVKKTPEIRVPVQESPAATTPSAPARKNDAKSVDIFAPDGDEYTMVDRDLQALDAMDLDTMSQKIRINCKQMIEKLHLEYLIDDQGS